AEVVAAGLARLGGDEARDVEAGALAVRGVQHLGRHQGVEAGHALDLLPRRQELLRAARERRAQLREARLGLARGPGRRNLLPARVPPRGLELGDRLRLAPRELAEELGVPLLREPDVEERAQREALALGREAHLVHAREPGLG